MYLDTFDDYRWDEIPDRELRKMRAKPETAAPVIPEVAMPQPLTLVEAPSRRFACHPADMENFIRVTTLSCEIHSNGDKETHILESLRSMLIQMTEVGVLPDETCWTWIKKCQETQTFEDLHYALHHMVFQMYWAALHGFIVLDWYTMMLYKDVTADCIESKDAV